jgi:DNA-binding NtrC family response regulator
MGRAGCALEPERDEIIQPRLDGFGPSTESWPDVVLYVSTLHEHVNAMQRIIDSREFTLCIADTLTFALGFLNAVRVPVVICDEALPLGTWKDILEAVDLLDSPPAVMVAREAPGSDFIADARRAGAYGVLEQPFNTTRVRTMVRAAYDEWQMRIAFRGRNSHTATVIGQH